MLVLMRCVAEAVMAKGIRGLTELVPGGAFLYDVAGEALRRLRDRRRADLLRQEVLTAAAASFEEARQAAERVAREVAADGTPEDRLALEMYLTQIPGAVRQSLRRAEDPSGKSVPANFALNETTDLLRQLPSHMPQFRPNDPLPGKPGWVLVELLGTGGFGEVWLARNPALSALKGAVKFGLDPQARDRLLRHEGTLVNRVMEQGKHPNVVQLLDAHLEGDAPWLMYEYVPGGDLTGLILAWQQLPPDERLRRAAAALRTLASAVGHFHRLSPPLVHRDLKPANILVEAARGMGQGAREGSASLAPYPSPLATAQLKVADFGIGGVAAAAALARDVSRRSSTGVILSQVQGSYTPLYASPQQQRGEPPDPRDDVHALGVIAFQMLTGKLDSTLGADYAKTLRRQSVPEPLIELLGDCAAHDPDNRPKDAAELAERLARLGERSPGSSDDGKVVVPCAACQVPLKVARGETRPIKCGKCGHTFRPFAELPPAPAAPLPAPPKTARPTARPVDVLKEPKPHREPEAESEPDEDEDERRRSRHRGEPQRRSKVQQIDEAMARGRRGLRTVILFVFGIPLLLLLVGGGVVLLGRVLTGGAVFPTKRGAPEIVSLERRLTLANIHAPPVELSYFPDGRRLLTVSEAGPVQVWDAENGAAVTMIPDQVPGLRPAMSPDGSRLVIAGPNHVIRVHDAATGQIAEKLFGLVAPPTVVAYGVDSRAVVAASEDGKVKAWEVPNKVTKPVELVGPDQESAHKGKVTAAVFDPKGRYLATAAEDGSVAVWAVDGWKPLKSLSAGVKVTALAWRPDGNMLLAGCGDGKVRAWATADVTDAKARDAPEPKVEALPLGPIERMVIAPQAHSRYMMFTLDVAGVGVLWDEGWRGERKPIAGQGRINAGAFSPDGNVFVSARDDRTVYFREMFFPDHVRVKAHGHMNRVRALAWRPDGKQLATIDEFGDTILWKVGEVPRGIGNPVEVGEK